MASTSDAAAFYATFQRLKADTADALSHNAPDAAPKLAALRAALAAARPTLPSYDQRSYDTQVRDLETKLAASRADKPKSRFAFKRAPPTGASASAPASASSSRAHSASPASPASPVPPSSAPTPTPTPTPPATTYTLSAHRNRTLTPSDYAGVGSYTLTLSDLADCVVDLRASPGLTSLHARDMRRCVLLAPIMAGSAMLSDMHECAVALGAQQFRLHDSADCALLLHTASMPVVERCVGVRFGAYSAAPGSMHERVQDFDWVRPGPSPHWSLLSKERAQGLRSALDASPTPPAQQLLAILNLP